LYLNFTEIVLFLLSIFMSHNIELPSLDEVNKYFPFGENEHVHTLSLW